MRYPKSRFGSGHIAIFILEREVAWEYRSHPFGALGKNPLHRVARTRREVIEAPMLSKLPRMSGCAVNLDIARGRAGSEVEKADSLGDDTFIVDFPYPKGAVDSLGRIAALALRIPLIVNAVSTRW